MKPSMYCIYNRYNPKEISMHGIDETFSVYLRIYHVGTHHPGLSTTYNYNINYRNITISRTRYNPKTKRFKTFILRCHELSHLDSKKRRIIKKLIKKAKAFQLIKQTYTCENCIHKHAHMLIGKCNYKKFQDKNGN